jgi:PAS domain S-box-containing protein
MSRISQIITKLSPGSIRGQLIAGITLVHLLLMTIFVFDLVLRQRNLLKKQNREQAANFVNVFAVNATNYIIANDYDALERFVLYNTNFPNLTYAMILSPDGIVLAHTNKNYVGKKASDDISRQLVGLTAGKTLLENDDILDVAVPIFADKNIIGWARAGVGQEYIQNNMTSIARNGIAYILVALLIGILVAILIGNKLTAGLYKLISTAEKIQSGNRDVRLTAFRSRELLNLGTAFNKMLDEISANESLLRMVIEVMPVGVWIFNEQGQVISGNSAGKEIWKGLRNVDISELWIYNAWYADTKEFIAPDQWAAARALRRGETTINEEIEIEVFDGTHKIILNSAMPLRGKNGNIIGAIALNVDITERKKMTEKLALSESTFRSAFDHSAIGMALVSPDGEFLRVNSKLCKMTGRPEAELLALTFQDITYSADLEKDMTYLKQTLNGTIDSYQMEKRYFHKGGHLIWVHLNVSLVRDGHGKPLFFVSQIEDINERKKTEVLVKESEEKFRKLVEESLVGVFILQNDVFVYVNPQLEKITGYSKSDLLTEMSFETLIEKEDGQKPWKNYLSELKGAGPSRSYFLKVIRKTSDVLHGEVILSPITYEGKPAFIGTIVDITERVEEQKRINKAVTEAQEKERQEISMELHDNVNQLMAGCSYNLDVVDMIIKDEKASAVLGNIKGYIGEAMEELRRISHQLAPSTHDWISLEEKIRTVVDTMNVGKAIKVRYHFDELQEAIKAEVQLAMYRIIQEQFTNILKHAKASLVVITVHRRNGDISMSIEDNGVGFDTHITKSGIGLENIKRRVQVFNGSFSIQALAGKGCKLDVQFPVD